MRVGIVALLQESNTFVPGTTALRDFQDDLLLMGEEVRARLGKAHHEVGGFFAGLEAEGIEAVPIFAARAVPGGIITAEAFARLLEMLLATLEQAGPLDGILAAPHGATVSESHLDADGRWLQLLRERLGPSTPIIATLDPHANLSPAMVEATTALLAYRTNPHLDQRERGLEASALMARTLRGEVRPVQAAAWPPLAINIEAQSTREPPCSTVLGRAEEVRRLPGILSSSIILGFPYADVPEMGSSAVVVADGNEAQASRLARELGDCLWHHRQALQGQRVPMDEALERAAGLEGPVCLLDMGDNVGGGAPGDATSLALALRARGLESAFVCLCDPAAAREAERAGRGRSVQLAMGGKSGNGPPLEGRFTVVSLGGGRFQEGEPRHGGFTSFDQGPAAVVRSERGMVVLVTSRRVPPFSLEQLSSSGIDPRGFHVITAKGVHAPVAAYAPVCRHFIRVDTPGFTPADMTRLPYRRRRRPLFPFEPH